MAKEVNVKFNEENWKQKGETKKEEKYVKKRKITKEKYGREKWKEKRMKKNTWKRIKKSKEHVCYPPFLKSQLWICVDTGNEEEWNGL